MLNEFPGTLPSANSVGTSSPPKRKERAYQRSEARQFARANPQGALVLAAWSGCHSVTLWGLLVIVFMIIFPPLGVIVLIAGICVIVFGMKPPRISG